jgi:hypothetical protein
MTYIWGLFNIKIKHPSCPCNYFYRKSPDISTVFLYLYPLKGGIHARPREQVKKGLIRGKMGQKGVW